MDYNYTEEQEAVRKMVREFALNELAPGAEERDRTGQFDYGLYRRLGDIGVTGMRFPEEFGGSDTDFLTYNLALEEIGRVDMSISWTLFVGIGAAYRVISGGHPEAIERWKDNLIIHTVKGEVIGAGAITEPGAGSDTRGIQTTAVLDGDEWVINGTKALITNAGLDNCCVTSVVCLTDREKLEFSTIFVPTGTPGYRIPAPYRKMGLRSSWTGELYFDDCRVPAANLVWERGTGRRKTVESLAQGRIQLSSTAIGLAQACLDEALRYSKERIAFRRPISQFQHVQALLVDMALNIELSRLLRNKVCLMVDEDAWIMKESSMLKYFACESANKTAKDAVQVFGGIGFMDEVPVSRYYRDVRAATLADGATEIQKWIIARELGC